MMGLPPDDQLRFGVGGRVLSEEELGEKLEDIISSWDKWVPRVEPAPPPKTVRRTLSGESKQQRGKPTRWLSKRG